jgi:hypothetical protein
MLILAAVSVGGILAAVALAVVFPTAAGEGASVVVGGLACVLGVCVAFYAVGRSEDRERAQRTPDP